MLHNFTGADGANPWAGLIRDSAGNLYGTTYGGGTLNVGTVFKLDAAGKETVLYSFTGGVEGRNPAAALILDGQPLRHYGQRGRSHLQRPIWLRNGIQA